MTIGEECIGDLRKSGIKITSEQEKDILCFFGKEPDNEHQWTEQDIYEQIQKLLKK